MQDLHVKYRPQDFDQVLGQDHVVKSLMQFEKEGNWPHAYLFSGPSGSGKCIVGSSLIPTEKGLLPINSYLFDYGYHSFSLTVASKEGLDTTAFFYKEEVHHTIKIQNELGLELEGTLDHPILTINSNLELEFKKLSDVKLGDFCVIKKNTQCFANENPLMSLDGETIHFAE